MRSCRPGVAFPPSGRAGALRFRSRSHDEQLDPLRRPGRRGRRASCRSRRRSGQTRRSRLRATPAAIAAGDSIFHKTGNCYACHGANAQGLVGPNLTDSTWIHGDGSYDFIVATVTKGIPKEESKSGIVMPPKGGSTITDDQVKQVAAYVYSLSHK